jgi:hypothetical protein
MTLLIKSTTTLGQSLVKELVKTWSNPYAFELPPELLPRSPIFT